MLVQVSLQRLAAVLHGVQVERDRLGRRDVLHREYYRMRAEPVGIHSWQKNSI